MDIGIIGAGVAVGTRVGVGDGGKGVEGKVT